MTVKLFDYQRRFADHTRATATLTSPMAAHWVSRLHFRMFGEPAPDLSSTLPPELLDVAKDLGLRTVVSVVNVISALGWLRPDPNQYQAEWDAWICGLHASGHLEGLLRPNAAGLGGLSLFESTLHNTASARGFYDGRRPTVSPALDPPSAGMVDPRARVGVDVLAAVTGVR